MKFKGSFNELQSHFIVISDKGIWTELKNGSKRFIFMNESWCDWDPTTFELTFGGKHHSMSLLMARLDLVSFAQFQNRNKCGCCKMKL